jgi:hypothetical protein
MFARSAKKPTIIKAGQRKAADYSCRLCHNFVLEKLAAPSSGEFMTYGNPLFRLAFGSLLLSVSLSAAALADGKANDRTQFGSSITIGPNDEVSDATCFFCGIRVRGHVDGDVTVFGGSIVIEDEGEVSGDVTEFGRGVRLEKDAKVDGDLTVFGGPLRRDSAASVGGDVTTFSGSIWLLLIFGLPLVVFAAIIALLVWLVRRLTRPSLPVAA